MLVGSPERSAQQQEKASLSTDTVKAGNLGNWKAFKINVAIRSTLRVSIQTLRQISKASFLL